MNAPIVILGQQRSGTTVFRQLLDVAGCRDLGEIFHSDVRTNPNNFFSHVLAAAKENPSSIHPTNYQRIFGRFLDERIDAFSDTTVVDVKHGDAWSVDASVRGIRPKAIDIFAERGAIFVHLRRRNKLRVFVSGRIALRTKQWRQENVSGLPKERRLLEPSASDAVDFIERAIASDADIYRWITSYQHHSFDYEDLLGPDGVLGEGALNCCRSILPDSPLLDGALDKLTLQRQNPEPITDLLQNLDYFDNYLSKTPHHWMLRE